MAIQFHAAFEDLTGHPPFGWQQRLFDEIVDGKRYDSCDIPTGLGKTSIIPVWLIALAAQADQAKTSGDMGVVTLPRRLVYVVNRRTVVDQATDDAERIKNKLRAAARESPAHAVAEALRILCVDATASPLAISTLRGEFADNREWQADPARAAIIVGTVDMIGSRLLFSGYGAGRSSRRALSAGLLGHDAWLVHDEAHLSQPFGKLVKEIARVQERQDTETAIDTDYKRALRVMEMSATRVDDAKPEKSEKVFTLCEDEKQEELVAQRLDARKALRIVAVETEDLAKSLADKAGDYMDAKLRVLIYVRTPELAKEVKEALSKAFDKAQMKSDSKRIALLTGTLRGHERDALVEDAIFKAFKPAPKREELPESLFLVATSAGEVGVDLDADHMICDISTLDSMIQRLGRVNRLGREDKNFISLIDAFNLPLAKEKDEDAIYTTKLQEARQRTADLLAGRTLGEDGRFDVSPQALRTFVDGLPREVRTAAFAPEPHTVPLTDILLDNWALTSVRDLPGRPPVHAWLHGRESEPPETIVVWREEAGEIADALEGGRTSEEDAYNWFDAHRIEPQERLRERTQRAGKAFDAIATRARKGGQALSAIVLKGGRAAVVSIDELSDKDVIANATVVLPLRAGGLTEDGLLGGAALQATDVADVPRGNGKGASDAEPPGRRWRALLTKQDGVWSAEPVGDSDKRLIPGLGRFNGEQIDHRSIEQVIPRLARCVRDAHPKKVRREMSFIEKGRVLLAPEDGPDAVFRMLVSFAPARSAETALDRSEAAPRAQGLKQHLDQAEHYAVLIAEKLALERETAEVIRIAARYHDLGKHRRPWQRAIGNADYPRVVLAKSDHRRFNADLCRNYRHEFGSLIEARRSEEISRLADWQRELVLHVIASHHGWARPHFKSDLDDPAADGNEIAAALADTPRFLVRSQRRFGRWGLAWLEALMKAADVMATTSIEPEDETAAPDGVASASDAAAKQEERA